MLPSAKGVQAVMLALACASGVACHRQTVQAAPPVNTTPAAETAPAPALSDTSSAPAIDTTNTAPENPPPLAPAAKPVEPKPRPVTPTPAPAPTPEPTPAPAKPAPPTITQRISPAQEAELRSQTEKSIAEAETNLRQASGHQLNDVQRDMAEKIRNFLTQAREAGDQPDWNRAHILADKARLLSVDLVSSL